MSKNIKTLIFTVFAFGTLMVPALAAGSASAQSQTVEVTQNQLCQGSNIQLPDAGSPDCTVSTAGGTSKLNNLIRNVINIFSVVVGVVAVIMMIYGGFRYITSGGDSGNVTSAKNTILYAIVGLIIVALAQIIVKFVLEKATQPAP